MARKVVRRVAGKPARTSRGKPPGRGGSAPGAVGQPPFVPSDAQKNAVMAYVAQEPRPTIKIIALLMNLPLRTLERHFAHELAMGPELVKARIGGGIVASALNGDKTMMIYYSKTQMGWVERRSVGFHDEKGAAVAPRDLFTINITG